MNNSDNRVLETEPIRTENSEQSPFKRHTQIKRSTTEQNVIMKQLHNLQYIENINQSKEGRRVVNNRKRQEYANRFVENIRDKQRSFQTLTQYHYSLIDDKCAFDNKSQTWPQRTLFKMMCFKSFDRICSMFLKNIQLLFLKMPLIYPETRFKIYWDATAILARLYFLYLIPLDLAWSNYSFLFDLYLKITIVMIAMIFLDMIVGFNTAYYEYGLIVTSRIKIIKHRLLRNFGLEWISIFLLITYLIISLQYGIQVNLDQNYMHIILILFLVHYGTSYDLVKYYEEGFNVSKKLSSILQLCKFVVFLFYILHIFSCFWFWLGSYCFYYDDDSWISNDLMNQYWDIQYLQSLYFSCVTMFTIGYGDVIPKSKYEKITSILFILITSIQLPYSVNTVGTIIKEISAYGEEKKKKLRLINSYMQKRKIPFNLQLQIRQYLNYYWQSQNQQDLEGQKDIIDQLSENLKEKLMIEAYSVMLNECLLFKKRFSSQLKSQLVNKIKSIVIPPETYVEATDQATLCFIDEGEIEISIHAGHTIQLGKLSKGQTLGLTSFIIGSKPPEKYKSIGFTKLMLLSREDFLETIKDFKLDYEIFCKLKDNLIFNPSESLIPMECFSCKSKNHKLIQCSLLHYEPDREVILKRQTFNTEQKREFFKRKRNNKSSRMRNQAYNTLILNNVQAKNGELINLYSSTLDKIKQQKRQRGIQLFYKRKMSTDRDIQFQKKLNRFQLAVRKVIIMNLLRNKSQGQMLNEEEFQQVQLQLLYERYRSFSHQNLFPKETNQIEFLIQKLVNKPVIDDQHFEIPKNYVNYYPNNNLQSLQKFTTKLKIGLINKFIPFFLYPSEIIKRFGCKPQIRNIVNYKRRKNVILF